MKRVLPLLLMVIITGLGFTSCDKTVVFDKYKAIPKTGWHKDSIVVFNIPVEDTLQSYNLLINIRNKTSYNFSNLWLFIEILQPDGEMLTDTFEIALADPSGKWLGDGIGGLKTRKAVFRRNVTLPVSGEYTVKLLHGMREDVLKGIHDVGFRIEKVN